MVAKSIVDAEGQDQLTCRRDAVADLILPFIAEPAHAETPPL